MSTQPIIPMPPQPTGNPLLDNPTLKAQLAASMQQQQAPQGAQLPPGGSQQPQGHLSLPDAPAPSLPASKSPVVFGPFGQTMGQTAQRGTEQGDEQERERLLSTGSGLSQVSKRIESSGFGQAHPVLGKVLGIGAQGLATLGDIGLNATGLGRTIAPFIPGTEEHHQQQLGRVNNDLGQDIGNQQKEAQTRNLDLQPQLRLAQQNLAQAKLDETSGHHQAQIDEQLRAHGFKADETGKVVPLSYDEMSEPQQAVHDLKASQEELADAGAALKKVQADPNSPQARIAQQRIEGAQQARSIALRRLGLSERTYDARYLGTDENGNGLPGTMLTDDGQHVGSANAANVRPTGTERNKADLANSAASQINDMKAIIQRHRDFFGPGYGQSTAFQKWIGSEDPDAQRFIAARTIAGDHLAGTFGGRSEAALQALDNALGQFKDNPDAALAGLDQLSGGNTSFQKAGSVRTVGSKAAAQASGPKEGQTKTNGDGDKVVYKGGKWQPAQ